MIDVVCAIIENTEGEILATRRPPDKSLGGMWEFPGGKLDDDESPEAALIREIEEELGIHINVGKKLPSSEWDYGTFQIRLIPFRATIARAEIDLREHTEARWLRLEELRDLDWAPADVPVVEYLVSQMKERRFDEDREPVDKP